MIPLPPPATPFAAAEEVALYAERCLAALGLRGWHFGWDRAVKRLGSCRPKQRLITLSAHFAAAYLRENPAQIHRTLLHELAHALAWERERSIGHGTVWRRYCAALGIPDEKSVTRTLNFDPRPPKPALYLLCHDVTGEVFREYRRRPRHTAAFFRRCYIPGRRGETLGHLVIRPAEH